MSTVNEALIKRTQFVSNYKYNICVPNLLLIHKKNV